MRSSLLYHFPISLAILSPRGTISSERIPYCETFDPKPRGTSSAGIQSNLNSHRHPTKKLDTGQDWDDPHQDRQDRDDDHARPESKANGIRR
jgi:hypothetical protein